MSSAPNSARRRGTTTLEFALIAGPFLLLLLAVFDIGRYFIVVQSLHTLLTTTARAVVVGSVSAGGTCPGSGVTLPGSLTSSVPLLDTSLLCVAVSSSTVSGQTETTVAAQYTFDFVLPTWSALGGTLSDSTTMTY